MTSSRDEMAAILVNTDPGDKGSAADAQWKAACKHGADEAFLAIGGLIGSVEKGQLALQFLKAGVQARNAYLRADT